MKLQISRTKNYGEVIEKCYSSDEELFEKFHILAPTTLGDAIVNTVSVFINCTTSGGYEMFKCEVDGEFAGYFGLERQKVGDGVLQLLTGFFIMPKFRHRNFRYKFLRVVKGKFPKNKILTLIYDKNERAMKFLKRNGGKTISKFSHTINGKEESSSLIVL